MSQKIRIKLKSYDYSLVDKSAEKIVKTVKATGAIVSGPICTCREPCAILYKLQITNKGNFYRKNSE